MADQLQILINTGFAIDTKTLQTTLNQIQKNTGLKINFDSSALNGVQTKLTEIKNSSGEVIKRISESVNAFGTVTTKIEELNQKTNEWSTKVKEVTNTEKLLTEEIKRQQAIKTQRDSQDRAYWDAKRQYTIEQLTATSQESLAQKAYYTELEKTTAEQARLNEEKKKANQFSSEKNAQKFYQDVIRLSQDYNKNLISAIELKQKLDALMHTQSGQQVKAFTNLDANKQTKVTGIYDKATVDAQNKAYAELNKLLTEEYNLRMRIENAKLSRYEAKDNKIEEEKVTVLEKELQKRLELNQAQQSSVNTSVADNRLANQEKLNQLQERELQLKSELAIRTAQIASSQQMLTAKTQNDLNNFTKGMNVNLDGLARKYSYVGGASAEIDKYRQALQGVTAENGKWYISQRQSDGTMQKTAVTAQQLRMQYRQMRNEIQSNINVFDTLRLNIMKFAQYFFAGGITLQFVRQIRELFSYVNQMDKYLTNASIITGKTREEVSGLTQEYIALGKALGATSTSVAEIAEGFYRQGKSAEETKRLIEATTMMAQLAGMGTSESTEYITSIMNGFKLQVDDVENVVSKLVSVDNAAATSVSEMAEALSKTSAVAQSTGVSLDSLVGYVATVSSTTRQEASSIGEAFKSIFTRMSDIKIGDYLEDGIGEANVVKVLDDVGVKLKENETTYRNFEDVISDLAGKWNTLSDVQMKAVSKVVAGTRQANVFMSLMSNMAKANDLTATSLDSAGLAQDRYNVYLESTEAKLNRLKISMQELYMSMLDSGFINMFIDNTTGVLNFVSALGGLLPVLSALSGAYLIKNAGKLATDLRNLRLTQGVKGLMMSFDALKSSGYTTSQSLKQLVLGTRAVEGAMARATTTVGLFNLAIGSLVAVLSLVYMGLQMAKQKQEEHIQSLKDGVSKYKESSDSIQELKTQYTELANKQEKTIEDTKKLAEIQDTLVTKFGAKKDAIDLLNGSLEDNLKLIDKLSQQDLEDAISSQVDIIKNARENFSKDQSVSFLINGSNNKERYSEMEQLATDLKEKYGDVVKVIEDSKGRINRIMFDKENMLPGEYVEALKYERELIQDNYKSLYDDKAYKTFSIQLNESVIYYNAINEALQTQIDNQRTLLNLQNQNFSNISTNTDLNSLEGMESSVKRQLLIETDDTKVKAYSQLLVEIQQQINFLNNQEISPSTKEVILATEKLKSALSSINTDTLSSDNAKLLSDALKTLEDNGKLTYEQFSKLVDLFPNLSSLFGECGDSAVEMGGALEYVQGMVDDYGSKIDELDSAIEKVSKGQQLSGEEIINLTRQYPQLQAKLDETTGLYYLELDALKKTREQTEETARIQTEKEIEKTRVTLENTKTRIQAYLKERIEMQKTVAEQNKFNDGYSLYSDALNGLTFDENGNMQNDGALTYLMSQDEKLRAYVEEYAKTQKQIADLQKEYDNTYLLGQEGDSSKKSSSDSYIENGFKDKIELFKSMREKLASEISRLQSDLEIAIQKHGDASPYVQKLKTQLEGLREEEKKLITSQADEMRKYRDELFTKLNKNTNIFEGLTADQIDSTQLDKAKRVFEKTIQDMGDSDTTSVKMLQGYVEELANAVISANQEIKSLGDEFYSNKKESLDEYISRVQDAISYEEELYSDKDNEAQLRFSILDETDDGYLDTTIAIQQDLIDAKIKLQETYKAKYEDLLKQGLSAESSVMRELKTKWNDTNKEIFDMAKERNEKIIAYMNSKSSFVTDARDKVIEMLRKQDDLQKDIYDKQKEAIKEKADADKEALENRKKELDAIKSEYDYQNKIADLRRALSDTLSDLNALEFDAGSDAIQAKVELANQLQDDKQALADEEFNHAIELAQASIDKAIEAIEKQSNAQTEAIDRLIEALSNKTDVEYRSEASNMLLNDEEGTYQKLLEYNREWGDGIDTTITSLFDSAKPVLEEIRNANVGIQEALNDFASLAYSKQLENANAGSTTIDGNIITGNGQIVSPDVVSQSLNNVVIPIFDSLKNVLANITQTPKNITLNPQFNVYADGNVDNATLNEAQKWFLNIGIKTLENSLGKYLIPRNINIAGTTK